MLTYKPMAVTVVLCGAVRSLKKDLPMNSPRSLLSCILIASIPLLASGPSWGKPTQDKSATKVTVKKAKTKARKSKVVAKKARIAPSKAAVAAVATVPVAVLAAQDAIQPESAAAAPVPAANPYQVAFQPKSASPVSANPYLAYQQQAVSTAAYNPPAAQPPQSAPTASSTNAYIATPQHLEPVNPWGNFGQVASNVKQFLPHLPGQDGRSILPSIKTVYPTGEKPLVVLTFKCPTELIGITPPPVKLLREGVNLAMDGINRSDLLSFNMQQVCQ